MASRRRNKKVSSSTAIPSPIGGWNARDSLSQMSPTDAVEMINLFPMTTECRVRLGTTRYATDITGTVESLIDYQGGSASELFAIASGSVYNVTSSGAVGAAELSGLSNSRWDYVNITTSGGSFMIMANGVDDVYEYDGASWSTSAITGVTPSDLHSPIIFKNRIYFVERNTLKSWYLPVQSIAGAAAAVDMSAFVQFGGYIVSHCTWTLDAGKGVDDYYVAITSNGEVIVYEGTDPASASTFAMRGVWRIGTPIGRRCMVKYGGDVLIITQDGLMPLSGALQSSRVNPRVALTDKISQAVSAAAGTYGSNFGWQVIDFPKENQLWLNVPISSSTKEQYVMNTISRAWCKMQDMNVSCLIVYQDDLYYGSIDTVWKAWDTYNDDGGNINAYVLPAFSGFGNPSILKRFTMTKPIFRASATPRVRLSINYDFNTAFSTAPLSYSPGAGARWGIAHWGVATWGSGQSVFQNWQGATGLGYYASSQLNMVTNGYDLRWVSTVFVYENGGVL
jgi:hypothetical protein